MQRARDAAYWEARASRERALAETMPEWFRARCLRNAEKFDRLAAKAAIPAHERRRAPRRMLPAERRAILQTEPI